MTTYQKFKKLKIDFSAIEFEQAGNEDKYFCTPIGAHLIGRAGVDGIHYCTVRGQGEMVFAVNPSNEIGKNVFPIANTFDELLSLLLACGSMAAIEQAHMWDEEQFEEFVAENQPTSAQLTVFDVLREKLGITPMEEPFAYLRRLQERYNYGLLHFPKEYYEYLDAQAYDDRPREWKVTIDGDFRAERGKAGQEITLGKEFDWGDEHWYVPAIYLCSGGVVADFCIRLDDTKIADYFRKATEREENNIRPTYEERVVLERENPMQIGFRADLELNGELIRYKRGRGGVWIPEEMSGNDSWMERDEKSVLEHYGLDMSKAWVIRRLSFPWEGRRKVELQTLQLKLEREKSDFIATRFVTPDVGGSVSFTHPITGAKHILTVREIEDKTTDTSIFHDQDLEFPSHFMAMTYILDPDLPRDAFMVKDCDGGDNPRPKNPDPHGRFAMSVGVVAMVRSADGPTSVFLADGSEAQVHAIVSSMHFEPLTKPVEWHVIIREKLLPDLEIALM